MHLLWRSMDWRDDTKLRMSKKARHLKDIYLEMLIGYNEQHILVPRSPHLYLCWDDI